MTLSSTTCSECEKEIAPGDRMSILFDAVFIGREEDSYMWNTEARNDDGELEELSQDALCLDCGKAHHSLHRMRKGMHRYNANRRASTKLVADHRDCR